MSKLLQNLSCPLCQSNAEHFAKTKSRCFYRCLTCEGIFVPSRYHPTPEEEFARYLKHQNCVHDSGYKKSVQPAINFVLKHFQPNEPGLDFGCGPSSAVTFWLRAAGYQIEAYDLYFKPHTPLQEAYFNYITCTEVIEHFRQPLKGFKCLHNLLRKNGTLICSTKLYDESIDFGTWYYKNDITHLFFYTKQTMHHVMSIFGFSTLNFDDDLIVLKK